MTELACPCCSGRPFEGCCEPFLSRTNVPVTAEQLMRSRYSAYALAKPRYLFNTWDPQTRPPRKSLCDDATLEWVKLEIIGSEAGQAEDDKGRVEFRAYWQQGSETGHMHENSCFRKQGSQWLYIDGEILVD